MRTNETDLSLSSLMSCMSGSLLISIEKCVNFDMNEQVSCDSNHRWLQSTFSNILYLGRSGPSYL